MMDMMSRLMQDITALGSLPFFLFLAAFLFVSGQIVFSIKLAAGIIIIYAITYIIRALYHKERPDHQKHKNHLEKIDASSFPSMHSMRVAMLCVFGIYYNFSILASVFFVVYASAIMMSRYILKRHDPIDIAAGAIIGVLVGFVMVYMF